MSNNNNENKVFSVYKATGKGYERGWFSNCTARYRCFAGARNSKKSNNIMGLEPIVKIMTNPMRNILFIRANFASHRHTTFANIIKLINDPLGDGSISLAGLFKVSSTTLEITYKKTGQKMIFDGMNNPTKLSSIKTVVGFMTDVYIEEAFELESYEEFRRIDGSIRGKMPDGVFQQITFCFNTWSKNHWLYEKFFKDNLEDDLEYLQSHKYMDYYNPNWQGDYGKGLYLHKSTYKINEFRDIVNYDPAMNYLRYNAPEIYKVEALGMWGSSGDKTYPEFSESNVYRHSDIISMPLATFAIGIDTGYSDGEGRVKKGDQSKKENRAGTATTMQLVGISSDYSSLLHIDEYYYSNEKELVKKTAPQLQEEIISKIIEWKREYNHHPVLMKGLILIYVDSADIGTRQNLEMIAKQKGLNNVMFIASTKIRIDTRVKFDRLLMAWGEFRVSSKCVELIREYKFSSSGEKGQTREDFDDHALNAGEYAKTPLLARLKRWKDFKSSYTEDKEYLNKSR